MYHTSLIKEYNLECDNEGPTVFSAAELKKISEDSKNVFPPSEYDSESVKGRRWRSIYNTDFNPRDRASAGMKSKSASTDHYRNKPHPSKMFMQWKVPSRLTDCGLDEEHPADAVNQDELARSLDKLRFQKPPEYRTPRSLDATHTTHHSPPRSLADRKQTPFFPEIGNQSPRLNSRATVSRLSNAQSAHSRLQSRASADQYILGSRKGTACSIRSNKPLSSPARRSADFVENAVNPDLNSKAHELLQKATPNEKRQIEKALRSAERRTLEKSLQRTLQPEAKDAVFKWLDTASEQDRKVAVKFFESLSGNKLMGNGSDEQNARIEQVINTLKKKKVPTATLG